MSQTQPMHSTRKTAALAGALFILATLTSIIGLLLYEPVLHDSYFIIKSSGNESQVIAGAFFELLLSFSVIGISVVLYPILKKEDERIALGYVCLRLLEAIIIIIGIISLLTIVTLSQEFSYSDKQNASSYLVVGRVLIAIHNWTFLFGPNLMLGPNTLLLAYVLYTSKLVPRLISVLGLIGGVMIFCSALFVLFGFYVQLSSLGVLAAVPVFAFEMILAVWLIVKGFSTTTKRHLSQA